MPRYGYYDPNPRPPEPVYEPLADDAECPEDHHISCDRCGWDIDDDYDRYSDVDDQDAD